MKLSTVTAFKNMNTNSDQFIHLEKDLLKRYQEELLKIAEDIIEVCEEEHISYHLTGGSALGAVRHQGFIPWDDDMDIDILGDDFPRFIEAFSKKYQDKYWIHTCKTPGYGMTINRVRLKDSVFRGREDADNEECGFFVDIIRIENTFDSAILRKLHGILCMGMGLLLSCRNFYANRKLMREIAALNPDFKSASNFKIRLGFFLQFFSVNRWARMTQACYGLCKNSHSEFVSVPAGRNHYFGEMYKREDFVATTDAQFEGHTWKIPKEYDAYLTHMYGDYMAIPKEEDREVHVLLELKFPGEKAILPKGKEKGHE